MVKKKTHPIPPQIEEHNLERGEEITATATPYEVGLWAGKPQYRCLLCKFDTLDEDAIFQHIEMHFPRKPKTSPGILVADKRGNDITDQVADDGDLNGVFEVELKEVGSSTDEQDNEHKTYTIKE